MLLFEMQIITKIENEIARRGRCEYTNNKSQTGTEFDLYHVVYPLWKWNCQKQSD